MLRLEESAHQLKQRFGRLDVPFGEVHRLRRGTVDLPVGGGPDTLHAVYAREAADGRYVGWAGDSYVLMVEWDREGQVHARSINPYGSATLDPRVAALRRPGPALRAPRAEARVDEPRPRSEPTSSGSTRRVTKLDSGNSRVRYRRAERRGLALTCGAMAERDPLSEQIHLLGDLLGQTIVEQEGPALFDLVEDGAGPGQGPPRRRRGRRASACSSGSRPCPWPTRGGS